MKDVAAIILAAGKGTRMKSDLAKVLHEISGVPMIRYVVEIGFSLTDNVVVVIGHQAESVRKALRDFGEVRFALQKEQLGTGHAVMTALPSIPDDSTDVVVLCGDTPLIRTETLSGLIESHKTASAPLTLLTTRMNNPYGYGRIVLDSNGRVAAIVEEADAADTEKKISVVNTGTYCMNVHFLENSLLKLRRDNVQGEFYLTDVVGQAYRAGIPACLLEVPEPLEVMGVNTTEDLAAAERLVCERME